ncbi:MAG: acyloxyacyl hydrolase [Thermoanaerobaculia bacterium]|nr:acyloxyacyl hydrolase [Thermoanaerobaculia bacterium]
MRSPIRLVVCLGVLAGASGLAPSAAADDSWLVASAGVFNLAADESEPGDRRETEVGLEWRGAPRAFGLRPNVGVMVHAESGGYLFAGARRDFDLSERWGLSLGFAAGAFEEGDGLDLGGTVEFRSSIELFLRLGERSRLGIDFYHLSNAGIYDSNPGANSLVLVYGHRVD